MKKILILAAAAAVLCSCANKNKYAVDGKVEGANSMVYLFDEKDNILDSAAVTNGVFRFEGVAEKPQTAILRDARDDGATFGAMLILEPGTINVTDDAQNPYRKKVTGTPANDASDAYSAASRTLIKEYRDQATTDERREAIEKEFEQLTLTTIDNNRDNFFGVALMPNRAYELSGQETLDEIAKFSPEMQQTKELTELKTSAEQKLKTDVGQPYIDIVQNNAEGEPVSLKSVIDNPANKYTLVDFWASWCGPCMGEVPHLKQTYDKFHKKGFEIYGVSFDRDRDKWLAAVKDNGMEWIHVSELQRFDNQAAKDYAVQGIPSNFLIDAQGKIVARNLRGEDLYKKVEELLGK